MICWNYIKGPKCISICVCRGWISVFKMYINIYWKNSNSIKRLNCIVNIWYSDWILVSMDYPIAFFMYLRGKLILGISHNNDQLWNKIMYTKYKRDRIVYYYLISIDQWFVVFACTSHNFYKRFNVLKRHLKVFLKPNLKNWLIFISLP